MENRLKSTTLDVTIGFQFVWFMIMPVQFYTPVISYAYCACTVMKRLHGLITIFSTRMCGVCGMISCKRFQDLHRGLNPIQFIYELKLIYSMLNRTVNFCWFCYSTLIFPLVSSLFFRFHAVKWWWMGLFYQRNQCISMELRHVVHHKSSIVSIRAYNSKNYQAFVRFAMHNDLCWYVRYMQFHMCEWTLNEQTIAILIATMSSLKTYVINVFCSSVSQSKNTYFLHALHVCI